MSHVTRTLVGLFALSAMVVPPIAHAREVKHCGITIAKGKTGTLMKDVQCGWHCNVDPTVSCTVDQPESPHCPADGDRSGCAPDSIMLEDNATLDLNGFQFTTVYGETGVFCSAGRGKCTVKGGFFLGGKSATPIAAGDKDLVLEDLTISGFYRLIETTGRLRATNVALERCAGGLVGDKGVRAKNITLQSECGLYSGNDLLVDGIDSNGSFGAANTVRARNATIRSFSYVAGKTIVLSKSTSEPDGLEIRASGEVVLRNSSIGGFESAQAPKLINATCQHSVMADLVSTWGVCTGDLVPVATPTPLPTPTPSVMCCACACIDAERSQCPGTDQCSMPAPGAVQNAECNGLDVPGKLDCVFLTDCSSEIGGIPYPACNGAN